MLETIQEIINSPHTDWTAVTIMLIVLGVVVFNLVYAIVAKIKGREVPELDKDTEEWMEEINRKEADWITDPAHPASILCDPDPFEEKYKSHKSHSDDD